MRNFNDFDKVNDRLADEATSFVWVFLLQLADGTQLFYCEGTESITVEGILYRADPGINVSAVRDTLDAASQTATIEIGYSPDGLTEDLIRTVGLSGAHFNLGLADYRDRNIPFVEVFSGKIDRVKASNPMSCSVDLTGWQVKSVQLPGTYSLKCRNVFCDRGCTLDIKDYEYPFTMHGPEGAASTDGVTFGIDTVIPEGICDYGTCEWTTGRNKGVITSVAHNAHGDATQAGQVKLMSPPPYKPLAGEQGILRAGCDFYADTCEKRYNNLANFAGEPAVPTGTETGIGASESTQAQDAFKPDPMPEPIYNSNGNFLPAAGA